jgi:deoxyadenosine/deoxycytidine kinase
LKKYAVLAGNIGAGKSTLVQLLADYLGFRPYFEPVAENPYLEEFYGDMPRWAFHSQIFFLMHRIRTHRALMDDSHSVVQDRSIYEDAEIFARNLTNQGIMSPRDWASYYQLFQTVSGLLPAPDLIVYLRASVPTLRRRIALRGRAYEAGISDAYLGGLNQLYEEWIASCALAPVLIIDGDSLDFVANPDDRELVIAGVAERLRDPQGSLFT